VTDRWRIPKPAVGETGCDSTLPAAAVSGRPADARQRWCRIATDFPQCAWLDVSAIQLRVMSGNSPAVMNTMTRDGRDALGLCRWQA